MTSRRLTRVNELMRREIGQALFRLVTENGFDMAAVTVSHVVTSPDLRQARVLISIRDHTADREAMLKMIQNHRKAIQAHINRYLKIKYTPRLTFSLDDSIEKGDRVLEILSHMEPPPGDAEPDADTGIPEREPC
jgi:ribosome-binding factor A